ncbi:MAG: BamA/TamA family outer membrane protein [Thiohalomonadales bacterium]
MRFNVHVMGRNLSVSLLILATVFMSPATVAVNLITGTIVRDADTPYEEPFPFLIPYVITTETLGVAVGVLGGISGKPQEQNSLFVTGLVNADGARATYLFFNDYQLSAIDKRLFIDASYGIGDFPKLRGYFDVGSPRMPPAGSNESASDAYIESSGNAGWLEVDLRYVLAAGSAKQNPINVYTLNRGLLTGGASGGESWNPARSGRTYLGAKFFYHARSYDYNDQIHLATSGIRLAFNYNNTDFPINPEKGSWLNVAIDRDPGTDGNDAWTTINARYSKYIPLSMGDNIEQSVLALHFWTADTLTEVTAPPNFGITLGGLYLLRGYPSERFYDRSAIYYSTELRLIPKSDWLRKIDWLSFLSLEWWEFVAFYEIGRVAPDWDVNTLHTDMKSDVGLGIRILMKRTIGRMDISYSEEDTRLWLMLGHPF